MTGRRHIRAGSVHVSELLGHHPELFYLPIPTQAESPDGRLATLLDRDPEIPCSHRKPPSKAAQMAKLAVLGVASCVLCAAIAYGSLINHEHTGQAMPGQGKSGVAPGTDLSGEDALLPDVLNRAVPKGTATAQLPGPRTNASDTIDNSRPTQRETTHAQRSTDRTEAPPTNDRVSKKELVEQFYRLAPSWPAKAYDLLDPGLLGMDVGQFVQSWSTVSELEIVDIDERGDEVLAVVRMRLPDGSHLRVQQLFDVANTVPRRIVGAEILSAQRS
jgi:hypothetical protein